MQWGSCKCWQDLIRAQRGSPTPRAQPATSQRHKARWVHLTARITRYVHFVNDKVKTPQYCPLWCKKYLYGVLNQPFVELACNDEASLSHQRTFQHCCGCPLASPRWSCLSCGAKQQHSSNISCVLKVCTKPRSAQVTEAVNYHSSHLQSF